MHLDWDAYCGAHLHWMGGDNFQIEFAWTRLWDALAETVRISEPHYDYTEKYYIKPFRRGLDFHPTVPERFQEEASKLARRIHLDQAQ